MDPETILDVEQIVIRVGSTDGKGWDQSTITMLYYVMSMEIASSLRGILSKTVPCSFDDFLEHARSRGWHLSD